MSLFQPFNYRRIYTVPFEWFNSLQDCISLVCGPIFSTFNGNRIIISLKDETILDLFSFEDFLGRLFDDMSYFLLSAPAVFVGFVDTTV